MNDSKYNGLIIFLISALWQLKTQVYSIHCMYIGNGRNQNLYQSPKMKLQYLVSYFHQCSLSKYTIVSISSGLMYSSLFPLQVLLEVLRLHSPASGIQKEVMTGGFKLPVGGYFLPEGTILFVS